MCQLIWKPAGFTIPRNLIESTCIVNPDGFGLMYGTGSVENGELQTFKLYNGDNDPDVLFPILEGLHDINAFIHFRYRTKGMVNEASCHPFVCYDNNDRKVALMHNGTLTGYGTTDKVDSEEFAEKLVGPLYNRFLLSGVRQPLSDGFFQEIVQKFIGAESKIAVADNTGDSVIFNYAKGDVRKNKIDRIDTETGEAFEQEIEWWVSNTYSFNTGHRKSYNYGNSYDYAQYRHGSQSGGTSTGGSTPFRQNGTSSSTTTQTETTSATSATSTPTGGGNKSTDKTTGKTQEANASGKPETNAPTKKETGKVPQRVVVASYWQDVLGLDDIDELRSMTRENISELVDLEPENAKLFINDLLIELFENTPWDDETDEDEDA